MDQDSARIAKRINSPRRPESRGRTPRGMSGSPRDRSPKSRSPSRSPRPTDGELGARGAALGLHLRGAEPSADELQAVEDDYLGLLASHKNPYLARIRERQWPRRRYQRGTSPGQGAGSVVEGPPVPFWKAAPLSSTPGCTTIPSVAPAMLEPISSVVRSPIARDSACRG